MFKARGNNLLSILMIIHGSNILPNRTDYTININFSQDEILARSLFNVAKFSSCILYISLLNIERNTICFEFSIGWERDGTIGWPALCITKTSSLSPPIICLLLDFDRSVSKEDRNYI